MGCYLAKHQPCNSNAWYFRVYNVNILGSDDISEGKIEVTESNLILHRAMKESIIWPLGCLRKYGFDKNVFSFESGRRCSTGSGIYAFKCQRAEELFNLVQESINTLDGSMHQTAQVQTSLGMLNGASYDWTVVQSEDSMPNYIDMGSNQISTRNEHDDEVSAINELPIAPAPPTEDTVNYANLRSARSELDDEVSALNDLPIAPAPPTEDTVNYANLRCARIELDDEVSALNDLPIAPAPPTEDMVNRSEPNNEVSALNEMLIAPSLPTEDTVNYANLYLPNENMMDALVGACAMKPFANGSIGNADNHDSCTEADSQNRLEVHEAQLNYADLDVFVDPAEDACPNDNSDNQSDTMKRSLLVHKVSIEQNSMNCMEIFSNNPDSSPVNTYSAGRCGLSNRKNLVHGLSNPEMNYIEMDFSKRRRYTIPESSNKHAEIYAMIDFNRTVALCNLNSATENDEGFRKTRHNSTLN